MAVILSSFVITAQLALVYQIGLLSCIIVLLGRAWLLHGLKKMPNSVMYLELLTENQWLLRQKDSKEHLMILMSDSLVMAGLIILNFKPFDAKYPRLSAIIARDSAQANEFRHLKALLAIGKGR